MKFLKENFVEIGIAIILIERIVHYFIMQPKVYKFLDFILEYILELSR